ncbi:hypothetical protein [Photorhabdus tasmaniensis]|uniref:Uncharacterized protein n=1 Tax=Photorhabdus tasmaniensis TaxID=1004159 RepID=A0ABX0GLM4_9GAMM|nr:hypothetical protein [Photorhabdus tasmaniensis]NHB89167.1 hypothetical protein [Photorhabdus tasmaniensis]
MNFSRTIDNNFKTDRPYLGTVFTHLASSIYHAFYHHSSTLTLMSKVSDLLRNYGRDGLHHTVNYLLDNEVTLNAIAQKSYLQGNGFYKIVLLEQPEYSIRLHIWLNGISAQENLHSHRWPFASVVTDGHLKSEIWIDSALPNTPEYQEFFYIGKHSSLREAGTARVELKCYLEHQAGDSYVLMPDVLHRVVVNPLSEMTATVICRAKHAMQWSRNVNVNETIPDVTPLYMRTNELHLLLIKYLDISSKSTIFESGRGNDKC